MAPRVKNFKNSRIIQEINNKRKQFFGGVAFILIICAILIVLFTQSGWSDGFKAFYNAVDIVGAFLGVISVIISILIYIDIRSLVGSTPNKEDTDDMAASAAVFFDFANNGSVREIISYFNKLGKYEDLKAPFRDIDALKINENGEYGWGYKTADIESGNDRVFRVVATEKILNSEKRINMEESKLVYSSFNAFLIELVSSLKKNGVYNLHVFFAGPSALAINIGNIFGNTGIRLHLYHFAPHTNDNKEKDYVTYYKLGSFEKVVIDEHNQPDGEDNNVADVTTKISEGKP